MKKNYLLSLGTLLSIASISAQPFWSEDFSGGIFPNGWSTEDLSVVGLLWEHCSNPYECAPFTQNINFQNADIDLDRFESQTAFNGYIFANSAALPTNPVVFDSQVTTPKIDCSNKTQVVLSFSTNLIYAFRKPSDAAFLRVKNENNDFVTYSIFPTWDEGTPALPSTATWNGQTVYFDITNAAAGFSEVQIQWQWQGLNEWNWALDDVKIFDYHPLYEKAIWGMTTGEGDFSGGLNDWQLGTNNPECPWSWNEKGWIDNQFPPQDDYLSICSHTPENGAAIMNATFCAPMGTTTTAHLISPPIDLTTVPTDCQISLKFFQQVQIGNTQTINDPITSISWSVNGGNNWSIPLDVNPLAEFRKITCNEKTIPLPNDLIGESAVQFRFTFNGQSFYWAIDDVRVLQNADNDLALKENFYAIAPNFQTPASQVDSFGLLVDFQNFGKSTQEDVMVAARIFSGENQALLYQDFLNYDAVESLQLVENELFTSLVPMPSEIGRYYGEYQIEGAVADEYSDDNILHWEFEITENVFAKERGARTGFAPVGAANYEMGNCFYLPNGAGFHAKEITFSWSNYPSFQGAVLRAQIYKWNISSPLDSIAEDSELAFLGGQIYVNNDNSTGLKQATVSLEPLNGDKVFLDDDSYYLVTVNYLNPLNCNGGNCPFFIGASDEFNYAANYFLSRNLTANPRFTSVLRQGNSPDFNTIGFNLKRTPVVRLHIEDVVETTSADVPDHQFYIFPNPADKFIFVKFDPIVNLQNAQITIFDAKGLEMTKQQISNEFIEQLAVSTGFLSSGLYVLEVLLADGQRMSKRFVKVE